RAGGGAAGRRRHQHRGDAVVVVDHLALDGAGLRVEDLVEIRQLQPAPVDLHLLLSRGHGPTVPPITRSVTRWGGAAPSADRSFLVLARATWRSEEHTSELQSRFDLVCRLL